MQPSKSFASESAFLIRELGAMLKTDQGRSRILRALPIVAESYFDNPAALRVLILRTMPYPQYLKTLHWHETSAAAKERAGGRCQLCNSADNLETHHRTYERRGCELDTDLTVLCDACHERFHREPAKDEFDSAPKLTEAQEVQWLNELIARKRAEQGIITTENLLSQMRPRSGTS
jgi:hypothetical protein